MNDFMSLKREVSQSIADLQKTVKRLALEEDQNSEQHFSESPSTSLSQINNNNSDIPSLLLPPPLIEKASTVTSNNSVEAASMYSEDSEQFMMTLSSEEIPPPSPLPSHTLQTVLSSSRLDFDNNYEKLEEIGRGGFSVVYKCRSKQNNKIFAVKIIDLRPLKLHERFDPSRLRREVDIMRQLRHPNIIQFVEVFENNDQLMVVMEYAPGQELFDVILSRNFFSEEDAKPIFQQMASALAYLHSLDIIHRDIKPENVLYLNEKNPITGLPITKILDFGLSKHAGLGSEAKTFVGTPCYLAPEVEMTAKGRGGTYGTAADCWSLGAVLYVMLVARFPEFNRDANDRLILKLPAPLWGNKSEEAKNLVKSLMCYDPAARLTALQALSHPWLGPLASSSVTQHQHQQHQHHRQQQLLPSPPPHIPQTSISTPSRYSSPSIKSATPASVNKNTNSSNEVLDMVLYPHFNANIQDQLIAGNQQGFTPPNLSLQIPQVSAQSYSNSQTYSGDNYALTTNNLGNMNHSAHVSNLHLSPLLSLQKNIANVFEEVHKSYLLQPQMSAQVREVAIICRRQVDESKKMLRKIEHTSLSVLNMFPDLELALEENEPGLVSEFFEMVKGWVSDLVVAVTSTQQTNQASIAQIQNILEISSQTVSVNPPRISNGDTVTISISDLQRTLKELQSKQNATIGAVEFVDLFSSLFDLDLWQQQKQQQASSRSPRSENGSSGYSSEDDVIIGGGRQVEKADEMEIGINLQENDTNALALVSNNSSALSNSALTSKEQLAKALDILKQVDTILDQLGLFWSSTEVVLDLLSKKGQHAEQFIRFSHNPKLHQRFKERVSEYRHFWEGVLSMCSTYLMGIVEPHDRLSRYCTPPEEVISSSSSSQSSRISSLSSLSNKHANPHSFNSPPTSFD